MSAKDTKAQSEWTSGLDLAIQLKEIALTIPSPKTRFLINCAKISNTKNLDFVRTAINNQLYSDTLELVRKRASIITILKAVSSVVSGDYKKQLESGKLPEELVTDIEGIKKLLDGVEFRT
jgi:hypothetical protein